MSASATGSDDARQPSSSSSSDRFSFLRSLRDVLFGRGRRATGRDVVPVPRVKSSRSLDDELDAAVDRDDDDDRGASSTAAASTTPADQTRHKLVS